jgi:serine/threonine-protein kinase
MNDDEATANVRGPNPGAPAAVPRAPASAFTELPTLPATTPPPTSAPPSLPGARPANSITTPAQALLHDEAERTRHFGAFGAVIMVSAISTLLFHPAVATSPLVLIAGLIVAGSSLGYLSWRARDPDGFRGLPVQVAWYLSTCAATIGIPYYGPFSAVSVIVGVGIYFVGLGASLRLAIAVWATSALVEAVTAGLVIGHVIDDPGLYRMVPIGTGPELLGELQLQATLLATLVLSRASRRSTTRAIGALEHAVRTLATREAMIEEARAELARAVDAGGPGRWTEQTLGAFRLGPVLGRGGMGEVYDATHAETGAAAAVKVLSRAAFGDASMIRRFLRELHTAAAISAPNVVRVLEVGEAPIPFLAMERLHGHDLAELLRRRGTLRPAELVDLARQVGAGITAASAVGIVHRDLKPQNVFLAGATWKVLDFGVAKLHAHDDSTHGLVVGTPAYMAPEQARGLDVDRRTDLYALAAILYRAITGRPPFTGADAAATLYATVHAMPPRPGALVPLPDDVDLVLAIGLAKQPDDRFATAGQLTIALDAAFEGGLADGLRHKARALLATHPWANA